MITAFRNHKVNEPQLYIKYELKTENRTKDRMSMLE